MTHTTTKTKRQIYLPRRFSAPVSKLGATNLPSFYGVPELWRYQGQKVQVFVLSSPALIYVEAQESPTFPLLALDMIPQFIQQSLIDGETTTLRSFRTWIRQQIKASD